MIKGQLGFRIAALLLAVGFVISVTACGGAASGGNKETSDSSAETTNAPEVSTHERVESDLPAELDFGGRTVNFLTSAIDPSVEIDETGLDMTWSGREIGAEELTNEPVNDAIYNRNLKVADQLNIEIKETFSNGEMGTLVRRDMSSGDGEYDIIAGSVCYETPLIYEGFMYNLRDNGIEDFVNLDKPWWPSLWLDQAMMGDRLYCITGSLSISLKRLMFVTYFNKSMAESEGIGNLYDAVRNGDWTIDYMKELSSGIYRDVNGNSEHDEEDTYGLLINHYECPDVYWSSFDMTLLEKDGDNWFRLADTEEKISNAFDIVFDLIYENNGAYDFLGSNGFTLAKKMFAAGNALFASMHLKFAESEDFRNMADDYGILPTPLYDKNQKNYYTYAHDQYTVFMIPITVKDVACAAATLEAMACESYNMVEVAFLDNALKGRYSNDLDTRQMIDLIVGGFKVDPAFIYGMLIGYPTTKVFHGLINDKKRSFATEYAKMARTMPYFLSDLRSKIEGFDY